MRWGRGPLVGRRMWLGVALTGSGARTASRPGRGRTRSRCSPRARRSRSSQTTSAAALVWAYDLPALTDDAPELNNLYIEDTATGALRTDQPFAGRSAVVGRASLNRTLWGASADLKHVGVVSGSRMLPEAAPGVQNAYKWDDGALSLVGLLPDDTGSVWGIDDRADRHPRHDVSRREPLCLCLGRPVVSPRRWR